MVGVAVGLKLKNEKEFDSGKGKWAKSINSVFDLLNAHEIWPLGGATIEVFFVKNAYWKMIFCKINHFFQINQCRYEMYNSNQLLKIHSPLFLHQCQLVKNSFSSFPASVSVG